MLPLLHQYASGNQTQHLEIWWSWRLVHSWNWCFHWSTETLLVTRHSTLFLMRAAAAIPTRDLPAPQGSTMMPA